MDYIYLSVIGSAIGTLAIIFISIYLYVLYRVRYIGIWALGWLILLIRYILFDSGLISWKLSALGLSLYQSMTFIFTLMIVWSTYSLINKPLSKWWISGAIGVFIASSILNVLLSALPHKLLLPIYVCCFAFIWVGLQYIRHSKIPRFSRLVVGWTYILVGLLNFSFPFIAYGSWILPWGYAIGGTLRLVIAIGTLILFFEKTRTDLSNKEIQYKLLAENAIDVIYYYRLLPEATLEYISPSVFTITGYPP